MRKPRRLTRRELNLVVVASLTFAAGTGLEPSPVDYGTEYERYLMDVRARPEPVDESPCEASPDERIPDWAEVPA